MNPNYYWATGKEMETVWGAIKAGDLKKLKSCVEKNPQVVRWFRWDMETLISLFGQSDKPTLAVLDYLLSLGYGIEGGTPEPYFGDGAHPLYVACSTGNVAALRALLKRGADVNLGVYSTALHVASEDGHHKVVSALLKAGANPNREDQDGARPLDLARAKKRKACVALLEKATSGKRKKFVKPKEPTRTVKIDAWSQKDRIRKLIQKGVREFAKNDAGKPVTGIAIYASAILGFVEIAIETTPFDPSKPDCAASMTHRPLARIDYPKWKKDFKNSKKIELHYRDGAPLIKSPYASYTTLEKPFFSMLVRIMKDARRDGDFDKLDLAPNCVFGVQIYYHAHCQFWNQKNKIVKKPEPWKSAKKVAAKKPAGAKTGSKKKTAKKAKSSQSGIGWTELIQLPKTTSGIAISPDGEYVAGATSKSASIWKLPAKKPIATIAKLDYPDDLKFDASGKYLFVQQSGSAVVFDMEALKVVSRTKKSMDAFDLVSAGDAAWIGYEFGDPMKIAMFRNKKFTISVMDMKHNTDVDDVDVSAKHDGICWVRKDEDSGAIYMCPLKNAKPGKISRVDMTKILGAESYASDPKFHPDLPRLAVVSGQPGGINKKTDTLCLIDCKTKKLIAKQQTPSITDLYWLPDGTLLCEYLDQVPNLSVRDGSSLKEIAKLSMKMRQIDVAWKAKRFALSNYGRTVVFDV